MDDHGAAPTTAPPEPFPVPTTFAGVAGIAGRAGGWLLMWQVIVALAAAGTTAWALDSTWGAAIRRAAEALPAAGKIQEGRLIWTHESPTVLHSGPYLSVVVDPLGRRESALTSDVTLSLEATGAGLRSVFGWATLPYAPDLQVPLERLELTGVLRAWIGPVLLWAAGGVAFGLWLVWTVLATIYGTLIWALAGFFGRHPTYAVAWRLAGAALLPGAILMTAAIGLYATRQLGFVGLLLAAPLHVMVGWLYCVGGLAQLQKPATNPFVAKPPADAAPEPPPTNPFERP